MAKEAKKTEPGSLISVRCSNAGEKEMFGAAARLEGRKIGPYVLWAAKEYTRQRHPEVFGDEERT